MNERHDIVLTEDDDLQIANGDFAVAQSDQQHVKDIFRAYRGEYKEFPLLGFGAGNYLKKNSDLKYAFLRDLRQQLRYDDYPNADIDAVTFDKIKITVK